MGKVGEEKFEEEKWIVSKSGLWRQAERKKGYEGKLGNGG